MNSEFNPETNAHPVGRVLRFAVRSVGFSVPLEVPFYINRALGEHHWQKIALEVANHARELLERAALAGYLESSARDYITPALLQFVNEKIYWTFCDVQRARGNEAWEVPASLGQGIVEVPGVPLC